MNEKRHPAISREERVQEFALSGGWLEFWSWVISILIVGVIFFSIF
jgi:hypothetical protein